MQGYALQVIKGMQPLSPQLYCIMRADPAVFSYDFTPVSTDITGVGVSLNIFSIAPCVVVVDAVGVKVRTEACHASLSEYFKY
jgi:hypothetical protein